MTESDQNRTSQSRRRRLWSWLAGIFLLLTVGAVATFFVLARATPTLRTLVIETLSTRFKSKVELDDFHVTVLGGFQVWGKGLRIFGNADPNNHEPGFQPIISVAGFHFSMGIRDFLRTPKHVNTVYVKGLQLNLPPREQRGDWQHSENRQGKIEIVVDRLVFDQTQLIINTLRPGKLPLEFDIANLTMTEIGSGSPMHFDAKLTNPKPVGEILSSGFFGPWQADSPRDTPVSGTYSFDHADLGTIKGIGGILSSKGKYEGVLDKIVVDGATDTPDFRVATSGKSVPLHTDFHAIVDGTSGDTYLQPVKAKILNSWLVANGSVVRTKDPNGHDVKLDVSIAGGKIEDVLRLAVRTDPPVMTGILRLQTKFNLPPGEPDVANRLRLAGRFRASQTHFTNDKVQGKVDAISMRSQGKPKLAQDNIPDNVRSEMGGSFTLNNGVLSFSKLSFQVPGTHVKLSGTYSLDGNQFDFHGKAFMDAKLSQMVTGWKSILLKPADPFFSKGGVGTEVPFKVTGTKSEPHFGTDFGHKDEHQEIGKKR
jgi:hypothetical protein